MLLARYLGFKHHTTSERARVPFLFQSSPRVRSGKSVGAMVIGKGREVFIDQDVMAI